MRVSGKSNVTPKRGFWGTWLAYDDIWIEDQGVKKNQDTPMNKNKVKRVALPATRSIKLS